MVLILSFVIAFGFVGYRYLYPPTPAPIFMINTMQLEYGETTITGILQKDSPIGNNGSYILVLSDMRPVLLDAQGLDNFLGLKVTIAGVLSPAIDSDLPMTMKVNEIIPY